MSEARVSIVTIFPLPNKTTLEALADSSNHRKQIAYWKDMFRSCWGLDLRRAGMGFWHGSGSSCCLVEKAGGTDADAKTIKDNLEFIGQCYSEQADTCSLYSTKMIFVMLVDGVINQCVGLALYALDDRSYVLGSFVDLWKKDRRRLPDGRLRPLGSDELIQSIKLSCGAMNTYATKSKFPTIESLIVCKNRELYNLNDPIFERNGFQDFDQGGMDPARRLDGKKCKVIPYDSLWAKIPRLEDVADAAGSSIKTVAGVVTLSSVLGAIPILTYLQVATGYSPYANLLRLEAGRRIILQAVAQGAAKGNVVAKFLSYLFTPVGLACVPAAIGALVYYARRRRTASALPRAVAPSLPVATPVGVGIGHQTGHGAPTPRLIASVPPLAPPGSRPLMPAPAPAPAPAPVDPEVSALEEKLNHPDYQLPTDLERRLQELRPDGPIRPAEEEEEEEKKDEGDGDVTAGDREEKKDEEGGGVTAEDRAAAEATRRRQRRGTRGTRRMLSGLQTTFREDTEPSTRSKKKRGRNSSWSSKRRGGKTGKGAMKGMTFETPEELRAFRRALAKSPKMNKEFRAQVDKNFSWSRVRRVAFRPNKLGAKRQPPKLDISYR